MVTLTRSWPDRERCPSLTQDGLPCEFSWVVPLVSQCYHITQTCFSWEARGWSQYQILHRQLQGYTDNISVHYHMVLMVTIQCVCDIPDKKKGRKTRCCWVFCLNLFIYLFFFYEGQNHVVNCQIFTMIVVLWLCVCSGVLCVSENWATLSNKKLIASVLPWMHKLRTADPNSDGKLYADIRVLWLYWLQWIVRCVLGHCGWLTGICANSFPSMPFYFVFCIIDQLSLTNWRV